MRTQSIGAVTIDRVVENGRFVFKPNWLFADLEAELILRHRTELGATFIDFATNGLILSFHSYLIRTPNRTILVDTCNGNHKDRPGVAWQHMLSGPDYLANLAALGSRPDDIDIVLCTHLHGDHVGWNTRLVDGRWVPTFPNAKYVMAKREYDHWQDFHASGADSAHALAFGDSILPVVKTGQALLVGDDYALDDGLWFESYPGHTPGNVVIHARSQGERGVFIGDVLHHPLQCLRPGWSTMACTDPDASRVSRTRLVEEHADNGALILPAHFPEPTTGHIKRHASAYRFDFRD